VSQFAAVAASSRNTRHRSPGHAATQSRRLFIKLHYELDPEPQCRSFQAVGTISNAAFPGAFLAQFSSGSPTESV
jgi:hypothetical protein